MRKLKVRRFLNEPGYCTIAASACVANYYDKNIDDNYAKEITVKKITKDANRDFWLTAKEAVDYKLVSKIIESRNELEKLMK